MIDISSKVFTTVANAVETSYPSAFCSSEYVDVPASFPCVTITEDDNYTYKDTYDDQLREHHAVVMYDINIYSNLSDGRKAQALAIAKLVDTQMENMRFVRTARTEMPNVDNSIFRYLLRYEAVVAEPIITTETVGDDTVTTETYQMFQR